MKTEIFTENDFYYSGLILEAHRRSTLIVFVIAMCFKVGQLVYKVYFLKCFNTSAYNATDKAVSGIHTFFIVKFQSIFNSLIMRETNKLRNQLENDFFLLTDLKYTGLPVYQIYFQMIMGILILFTVSKFS